jgi:hypothetical protein
MARRFRPAGRQMTVSAKPFHVNIHARPDGVFIEQSVLVDGIETKTLAIRPQQLTVALPVSFEEAESRLAALPRLFIEPDGSFVWVSGEGESPDWQLDGMMYDRNGHLLYVEMKGNCAATCFRSLLAAIGDPGTLFVVQLVHHGLIMDAAEFCRTRLSN